MLTYGGYDFEHMSREKMLKFLSSHYYKCKKAPKFGAFTEGLYYEISVNYYEDWDTYVIYDDNNKKFIFDNKIRDRYFQHTFYSERIIKNNPN